MNTISTSPSSGESNNLVCTCPSGDGSLRWPCPSHPPHSDTLEPGTVEVRTAELIGRALDAAVALALGGTDLRYDTVGTWWVTIDGQNRALSNNWSRQQSFAPSTEWNYGGPIIDRQISFIEEKEPGRYFAGRNRFRKDRCLKNGGWDHGYGSTALIAAMRCFVASKLGSLVKLPVALVKS